jgi:hypothetical protein
MYIIVLIPVPGLMFFEARVDLGLGSGAFAGSPHKPPVAQGRGLGLVGLDFIKNIYLFSEINMLEK